MVSISLAETQEVSDVMNQLMNIIIKSAFKETHLKQIGKTPKFFDVQNPIKVPGVDLQIWSGFKAAAM